MNVIIIGGGASGVICALQLKRIKPDISVTILEQNEKLLKKILKTGNGKCNIMNSDIQKKYYNNFSLIEEYQKKIDVYETLSNFGLVLKEMNSGRIYPYSEHASTVVNVLTRELEKAKVEVIVNCEVKKIDKKDKFLVNDKYIGDVVVMATGSLAQEKTNGYSILASKGLKIVQLSPGLVSFDTIEKTDHLSGLRVKCDAYVHDQKLSGEILFKNAGLSGVLALDISRYIKADDKVCLDLMPEYTQEAIISLLGHHPKEALEGIFPKMIVKDICTRAGSSKINIARTIKNYVFTVAHKLDFNAAQIALGGIDTAEISKSFESKKIKDLYIVGELLDYDGASGGYNLYFAWLSGIVSANAIAKNQ